jgi:hypothetical protein
VSNFLQQYLYLSQHDIVVAISVWILPRMSTLLWDLVSIATKWLARATKFGCRSTVAILQHPCILLQYTYYIAIKHVLIMTKLNRGNMHGLLPQTWKWWQYYFLLQQNVVVVIKIVAIDRISCSFQHEYTQTGTNLIITVQCYHKHLPELNHNQVIKCWGSQWHFISIHLTSNIHVIC